MLIGLIGYAGAGKSEVARHLCRTEHLLHRKFATPLKNMLRSLLRDSGCPETEIERYIEGDLKNEPTQYLMGNTPRHLMQTLGTEWGRRHAGTDFWVEIALSIDQGVVLDDVRFLNEALAIKQRGGYTIRVVRKGVEAINGHPSEHSLDDYVADYIIYNDHGLSSLYKATDHAVQWIEERENARSNPTG